MTVTPLETMSKPLSAAARGAATTTTSLPGAGEVEIVSGPMMGLLAVGICVLVGWVFVRILRPEKFLLRRVPRRPNHLNLVHVLAMFLLYFACTPLAMTVLAKLQAIRTESLKDLPMTVKLPGAIFGQLVLIGGALTVAAINFRHGLRRGLGMSFRHGLCDSLRAAVACLAVLPVCYGVLVVTQLLMPEQWVRIHPILEFTPGASPFWLAAVLVSTVVLAPLSEELLYRGLLQSMIRQHTRSPWPAILVTSGVFAASHSPQYQDMPALFVLALALGYNYERTGRLVAPILLHALFNAAMLWARLAG